MNFFSIVVIISTIGLAFALVVFPATNHGLINTAHSQTKKYSQAKTIIDDFGVPIVDYGYVSGEYVGLERNPLTIAHHGLAAYAKLNSNNEDNSLQKFLNISNWLVANAVPKGNYSLLTYSFYWPTYDVQPPWQSGMAQARALDVLGKAYELTNNQTYLDTAKSLLSSFFVEVKDGGVTYKTPNEGWWYEEYASPGVKETRVLNGHTFALLSLYDFYKRTNDPYAKYLFDQGVLALKNNLSRYEYAQGEYSTYNILNNNTSPSPLKYHRIHVNHLGNLYNITGDQTFKIYHDMWSKFSLPEDVLTRLQTKEAQDKSQLTNTTSANTTSANTTSANTTSANTTSANTTSANTTSANTTSANTLPRSVFFPMQSE